MEVVIYVLRKNARSPELRMREGHSQTAMARHTSRALYKRRMKGSKQIKEAGDEFDVEAREMAGAFLVLMKHRALIPSRYYRVIEDAIRSWASESGWESSPRLLPAVLPHMLSEAMRNRIE